MGLDGSAGGESGESFFSLSALHRWKETLSSTSAQM